MQCVDITFADPKDVPEVTPDNCSNSSWIGFDYVYSTASLTSDAPTTLSQLSRRTKWVALIPMLAAGVSWWIM